MPRGEIHVPLWVDYADDPKIIAAGERAELLYLRALCMMKRTLSDGFVADVQLARFGLSGVKARAATLIAVGLWERVEGGYTAPGFLKRNPSRDEIEVIHERKMEAGVKGNHTRWHHEPVAGCEWCAIAEPVVGAIAPTTTVRSPIQVNTSQVTKDSVSPRAGPFVTEFDEWWQGYPRKTSRADACKAFQARRREGITVERLSAARDHYAQAKLGTEQRYLRQGGPFLAKDGPWSEWEHGPPTGESGAVPARAPDPQAPAQQAQRRLMAENHAHLEALESEPKAPPSIRPRDMLTRVSS